MVKANSFKDLIVWERAHEFVLGVYKFTKAFPKEELFGLTSQLRRAAVSIPANIAEGFKRKGKADKIRFFNFSQSSLEESRYYLLLSDDLKYGQTRELNLLIEEISKLLHAYIKAIEKHSDF